MEEEYWKQFWVTGKISDYMTYRGFSEKNIFVESYDSGGEKISESDYSDRNGDIGITYR